MKDFTPTSYTLECVATGRTFEDEGWMMEDRSCKTPSLVRARYAARRLEVRSSELGLYKYADWLPVNRMLEGSSAPVTYKSKGLAKHLGLENLYITFNGYYPAIGARMTTCSFKETEAFSVCARAAKDEKRVLVVASAGNTARAFAKVCSDNGIKLLLAVPAENLQALWFEEPLNPCVKLICCEYGGDYFDAIRLSAGFMTVIVFIRHIRNVVDDQFNFAILLNGDFHHAGVLPVAFFIFQSQTHAPGIEFFLFGGIRAVLPGWQHQIPVVVVPFREGIFFDNRHHQSTRSVVSRLPRGDDNLIVMID